MKTLTFIVPFLLIVSLAASRESKEHKKIWSSLGQYQLNVDELTLRISKDSEGLIRFRVTNREGLVRELGTGASVYQRWFVFWGKQGMSLWFYSGDIGCSVFSIDDTKGIEQEPGSVRDIAASIPELFWME